MLGTKTQAVNDTTASFVIVSQIIDSNHYFVESTGHSE